jgi:hypothetical protein
MDFTELLIEARERSGLPFVIERGSRIVKAAETFLQRRLKAREMETVVLLPTDEDGIAITPPDYLAQITDQDVTIQGDEILTNVINGSVEFRYYAKLPSAETNGTNWLLSDEPEIYMQAVLMQIYTIDANPEKVSAHRTLLDSMIQDRWGENALAKYGNRVIDSGGVW